MAGSAWLQMCSFLRHLHNSGRLGDVISCQKQGVRHRKGHCHSADHRWVGWGRRHFAPWFPGNLQERLRVCGWKSKPAEQMCLTACLSPTFDFRGMQGTVQDSSSPGTEPDATLQTAGGSGVCAGAAVPQQPGAHAHNRARSTGGHEGLPQGLQRHALELLLHRARPQLSA